MDSTGEPVIHIGFPKCASTFLQQEIFPRVTTYQFIQDPKTHSILHTRYYHNLPHDFLFFRLGRTKYIFSNEGILNICEHWSDRELQNYEREIAVSNLTRIFRDYGNILVVIRRQDDVVESLFRHKAWKFSGRPESVFLDFPINKTDHGFQLLTSTGRIFTELFDYYKWIMRIANELGKRRIHILIYEDLVYSPDIFFQMLGSILEEDIGHLVQHKDSKKNVSLRRQVILPKYAQPFTYFKHNIPSTLQTGLRSLLKREIAFGAANRAKLLNLYRYGNKRLSEEFGLELNRYGYF